MHKWIIYGLVLVFSLQACKKEDPVCYEPTTVTAPVKFVQRTLQNIDTLIGSTVLDTFYLFYNDTILPYLNAVNVEADTFGILGIPNSGNFLFYLNPNSNSTSYAIRYDTVGTYTDTITLFHQSYPVFISNACGYTYYYDIDSIRYNSPFVDSTFVANKQVTLEQANGAKVAYFYFFKTL